MLCSNRQTKKGVKGILTEITCSKTFKHVYMFQICEIPKEAGVSMKASPHSYLFWLRFLDTWFSRGVEEQPVGL